MSRGRCSGCGLEDASCSKIRTHVMSCPQYVALFQSEPQRCLDPEDEYVQHKAWLGSEEGQAAREERREVVTQAARAAGEKRVAAARSRWELSE